MIPIEDISIIKRDGAIETFVGDKIRSAISKAYRASSKMPKAEEVDAIVNKVIAHARERAGREIAVEEIQDFVERELMKLDADVAKRYIIYREWRNVEREKRTQLKQIMDGIVTIEKNDVNLSNANMSAYTPAGQMMTFAAEVTKDYAQKYLLEPAYRQAHNDGDIHIHDLDYYPTKTATCVQYDLEDLLERGLRTKNGSIRTPQSIQSYATLATIIFQTNQNEQHGGQAIPAFDFFMAPGVRKTFDKEVADKLYFLLYAKGLFSVERDEVRQKIKALNLPLFADEEVIIEQLKEAGFDMLSDKELANAYNAALDDTERATHQAMEGFIHNLNTMHSRGGNQVVFSSINYGTDTSEEGRMVIRELLKATVEGLGKGETPIFPIQIFKVKEGVNFSLHDYEIALYDFEGAMDIDYRFETPNFDLFLEAVSTTAHALFPNFLFLDAPYNVHEKWQADDPQRYKYEIATMGCRTRVFENLNGEKSSLGRGNLSFTTINLPRLAILARKEAENELPLASKAEVSQRAVEIFYQSVDRMARLVAEQLKARYEYQRTALARQFPFMMGNDVWKGGKNLEPTDEVGDVWKSGTLGIGFIGGHNAVVALTGKGHGEDKYAWDVLYKAIEVIGAVVEEYKAATGLNYSVLATPAEGLSGRFTKMDRKRFGVIPGVTDLEYYVNSFHIDVRQNIGIFDKIRLEAPFHAITRGGHITYVELDGEAKKNPEVILKIVKTMKDSGIGYGSINHPIDSCSKCGYRGIIEAECPVCGSREIARLRRITGYLTGTLDNWNSAKKAEERDRVKHR